VSDYNLGTKGEGASRFYKIVKEGTAPKFQPELLGDYLTWNWPAAKDPGGRLYAYHDHAWLPDGEEFYKTKIRQLLRPGWKSQYATETITYMQTMELKIQETPPRDTIRVKNGILRVHNTLVGYEPFNDLDPNPISPVVLPVHHDQAASSALFEKYLKAALPDRQMQTLMQEIMGYMLVPDNTQQKAFLFLGDAGNGKSTLLNIMRALIGPANCSTVALHEFADKFAAADLYGKLMNTSTERRGKELSSSDLFLKVVGGDAIRAERKYEHPFDFQPFARLVFAMKRLPHDR
jgi:phage/plasmid-associated DNA primase